MKKTVVESSDMGTSFSGFARLLAKRIMGRITFANARFGEEDVQLVFDKKKLANYKEVINLPLGSLIRLEGTKIVTKTDNHSIEVLSVEVIYVFKESLPDKYHGLNPEIRYRHRVLDLMSNPASFALARKYSDALRIIRMFLYESGFREFNTGVLQEKFEGGQANSFVADCHANNKKLYLSLTSELKLKRLLTAGFEKVFEIAQSFRNEGIDRMHSPEFTLLEAYAVGKDYEHFLALVEEMTTKLVREIEGGDTLDFFGEEGQMSVSYCLPFRRLSFVEAFERYVSSWKDCNLNFLSAKYPQSFNPKMSLFTWLMKVIEKMICPNIIEPAFLVDLPQGMSPLVKDRSDGFTERAFFIAHGLFIADIYTDEENPELLHDKLRSQAFELGMKVNEEYLEVINLGLPKSAGMGFGINRLFMLFLGNLPSDVKETILYPIL